MSKTLEETVNKRIIVSIRCETQKIVFPTTLSVRPAERTSSSDLCEDGRENFPCWESKGPQTQEQDISKFNNGHPGLVDPMITC